jgi:hypothetical protein
MRKAHNKTDCYRIRAQRPDNWDRRRGVVSDLRELSPALDDDDVDGPLDQFARHRRQPAEISGSEPVLDCDVLAVDIAEIAQSFPKGVEYLGRAPIGQRQDADAVRFFRLLRQPGQGQPCYDRP